MRVTDFVMRMLRFIITALVLGVAGMATAQTGCIPKSLPWSEDFDSCGSGSRVLPPCWSASHNYDLGAVPHVDTAVHYNGTASLMLYSGSLTGSHYSIAIGPEAAADLASGVFARFRYYALSTAVALEVGICDDTNRYTRNFVPLDTIHADQGQRWKEVVVDLSSYTGTGRRLAFRLQRALQTEASLCYIDNLRLEGCGTTMPRVFNIGHDCLSLEWEHYGAGDINLEYNGITINDVVSPLTLTNLSPLTEYTLSLGCANGIRQEVSVSTLAGPSLEVAYYEPFSSPTLPQGWLAPLGCSPTIENGTLKMSVAGDSCMAVLPLPVTSLTLQELTLALRLWGDTATRLVVGVMDYGGEVGSLTALATLAPNSTWHRYDVNLTTYTGTGRYIALMTTGNGTLKVDDLRLAHCLIDNIRLYDLTDASLTVAWDTVAPTTGTTVTIEYGVPGFASGSGTLVTATTNPFVLNGLTSATSYDILVRPACNDNLSNFDRQNITTFSHEVAAPYCKTFEENGALPQGWVCGQGSAYIGTTSYEGSHGLHLAAQSLVALPRISTSADDTVIVEFYSYSTGSLVIGFMANPYGTFLPADTLTGGSGWRRQLSTLAVPEGRLLALRSTTAWDIDALAVHSDAVTTTAIDDIGKTSARVNWQTLRGDSVEVEYSAVASATADFVSGTGTILHGKDSLTLEGLAPGTFYTVHLRPVTDGEGCLYQTCHLQTAAEPQAVPYCENFDNLSALPAEWRRKSDYGEYPIVSTERNHSPGKALRFSATATAKTVALLPDFVSNSDHVTLAFWTNATLGANGAMMLIGHLSDIADLGTFEPCDTIVFSRNDHWEYHLTDLGTRHGQVALMLVGGGSGETRVFVDDICVEPCATERIRVATLDSTSLSVSWDSHGAAALDIAVTGGTTTLRDTFATSPAIISGLEPNIPYYLVFRTICECGDNGGAYYSGYGSDGEVNNDQMTSIEIWTEPTMVSVPFCKDFESDITGQFPYTWVSIPSRASVSDRNYHNGSHSLMVKDSCYIVLPPMENIQTLTVSLHAYSSNESGLGRGVIEVGVMNNRHSTETFETVDSMALTQPGEWQRLVGDLESYDGNGRYIALKIKARDTCTFFLDDLTVAPCTIDNAEVDETGTVHWEGVHTPTKVAIEYGLQGFVPGSGLQDTAIASPYHLQELTAGENYDIYLTPVCDTMASCMAVKVTLGATASTPYCEHFETAPLAGMPAGWSVGRTYGGTPAINDGNNRSMRLRGHSITTHRSIAVLPLLTGHDTLQLGMSLRTAGNNARLIVGHIGDNADPNTFTGIDTLEATAVGAWQRVSTVVTLPSQKRLALCCFSINQNDAQVWIDSLSVTRGISPTLSATSARTLDIGGTTGYIEYGPAGFVQGNGTVVYIDSNGLTIEGLTPETEYWFYTREDSLTLTCMPPDKVHMPVETSLPYCQGDTTIGRLQLPEMAIDSIRHLHLYLTLDGESRLAVGVMEHDGDWEHLITVDTVEVPSGVWQQAHVTFDSYNGNGRFVGLLSLAGNIDLRSLTATECPWITIEENDDNSVTLYGNGTVEYGLEGFAAGNGTTVAVTGSLQIMLQDTMAYDFYPLCPSASPCYAPIRHMSTLEVPLPYCNTLTDGLPIGWTLYNNALADNAIQSTDSGLVMTAAPSRELIAKLPIMTDHSVVVDMEVHVTSNDVVLLLDNDTVSAIPGIWKQARMRITHGGRIAFRVLGNGTACIRNLEIESCTLPLELIVGQPGGGDVELSWDTLETDTPFFIEYRLAGNATGITHRATESPLSLQLLPDTSYSIYLKCDSTGISCREPITFTTLSNPLPLPYCTSFETDEHTPAPERWYSIRAYGQSYLVMPQFDIASLQSLNILITAQMQYTGQSVTLGAMSDAGLSETFDSLTSFVSENSGTNRFFYSLANYYGNGRFLALRLDDNGWVRVDHLSVDTCAAYNFAMTETETDHIVLEWEQQGSPTVRVEYGPAGFSQGEGTVLNATESPLRIDSLAQLTDYAFLVSSSCSDSNCRIVVVDTFLTFIPKGGTGCIDYTDLHASYVSCKYGSFSNPTEFTGIIDKGYLSAASRHTVHFDTTERDARTGNLLRTVPPDEQASVRLGNWTTNINPQAESITYALTVDTNDFDLLVLRYAAVLQDPEHSPSLQPRFRMQILNQNNEIIDECSAADFIANPALVENTSAGSESLWHIADNDVLWKDWTTVGVDLSVYAGQTIFIRLITNDCGEGSHFGYAYFTLGCSSKSMHTEGCSEVADNRFSVPSGFNYRWYTNQDTTTISNTPSIWVPSDNNLIYYCQLSFIDNADCYFTMSAFAGARYPLAIIDTSLILANCSFDLTLTNRSTISGDGITPIGTGERCETGVWILPDSSTSTAQSLTLHLADTGTYDIALIAGIANDQCLDTLRQPIHIAYPYPAVTLSGRTERCDNDLADLLTLNGAFSSSWDSHSLSISPLADTTVTVFTVDSNGCNDTLHHTLQVHPSFSISDRDTLCASTFSYAWRDTSLNFTYGDTAANAILTRTTVHGCDSTMTLHLLLHDSYNLTYPDTLCDNLTITFFDTILSTAGNYLYRGSTTKGCDSLVTVDLAIVPTYLTPDPLESCDSLRWQDGELYLSDTIGALRPLHTIHGCDSVIELHLNVFPSHHIADADTLCSSTLRYAWRDTTLTFTYDDTTAHAVLSRHTLHSCDSIMQLDLLLLHSYDLHPGDTICDNQTLAFFDTVLNTTGDYLHKGTTQNGCDSSVTMHLLVAQRAYTDDTRTVCDSMTWIDNVTYFRDTAEVKDTLATVFGCDSTVTLYLTVHHSTYSQTIDTFCQGSQYQFRDHLLDEGGYYADTLATHEGCDSVIAIALTRLATPQIDIIHDYDCDSLYHHLEAHSDVPYLLWTADPHDSLLDGHEHDSILDVNPNALTTYTLYADYDATPHCPTTISVPLAPAQKPEARMSIRPLALELPRTEFTANDRSAEYKERAWYINGVLQSETSRILQANAPTDKDTMRVTLVVGDGHCVDSAFALIPLLYSALAAPNAFTPDRDDNNLFIVRGIGVLQAELRIYNRRGMLVFYTDDFNQPWDGRNLNGEPCPTGSYVWHLRYTTVVLPGAFQEEKGAVLLIR